MEEDRTIPGWVFPLVGVVVVVGLVMIGLNRAPAVFDPDTPEGTVQAYIGALVDGEFENAVSYWSEAGCIPGSTEPTAGPPDISASLADVQVVNGEEATVVIAITENAADPIGGLAEYQEWFYLVREDGAWRISQPSWPYHDQVCEQPA